MDGPDFAALGLSSALLETLTRLGYDTPTAIQAQAIPPLLAGRDIIGQAQTGTGKTAAFTLPLLERLDLSRRVVQAIVLAPTRELAMQVSEALSGYGSGLGRLQTLTVYGGAPIGKQLDRLRAGVHVVVGTPGRILDCMRREALDLTDVRVAVVDEADEMLRMGFIDDVEAILAATPTTRQTALFSATMAPEIERIARQYLRDPVKVNVREATRTVANIEQHVLCVAEGRKLEALARLIEHAEHQAMLVFTRTRATCAELAEALESRGHSAAALHGDMSQSQREDVLRRLRAGRLDLLIATDVAARGLDVDDITHVINFDPPMDPDTYVHRIGRTGRAGRDGASLLMLTPRQRHIRTVIERHTRQMMTEIRVPSNADLAHGRVQRFKAQVVRMLEEGDLRAYEAVVGELVAETGAEPTRLAAALAALACHDQPLLDYTSSAPAPEARVDKPVVAEAKPQAPAPVAKAQAAPAPVVKVEPPAPVAKAQAPAPVVKVEAPVAAEQRAEKPAAAKAKADKPAVTQAPAVEPVEAQVAAATPAPAKRKADNPVAPPVEAEAPVVAKAPPAAAPVVAKAPVAEPVVKATPAAAPFAPKAFAAKAPAEKPVAPKVTTDRPAPEARADRPAPKARVERAVAPKGRPDREERVAAPSEGVFTEMFLSIGQNAGLRAGDLVGAITNEARIPGKAIGAINVGPRSTLFGLAPEHVDTVLLRMGIAFIRGRKATIAVAKPPEGQPHKDSRGRPRATPPPKRGQVASGGAAPPRRKGAPRR